MKLIETFILLSILVFATVSCQGSFYFQANLEETGVVSKGISGVEKQDYREGEILVKFKDHVTRAAIEKIARDLDLEIIKVVSAPNLYLLRIRCDSTVQDVMERLKQFEGVEYSEPNYIRRR